MKKALLDKSIPFRENRFLHMLLLLYLVFWGWMAIEPYHRFNWFLENLLIFATMIVLTLTYKYFKFNNLSYLLMALFISLHTLGAKYSYSLTPIDDLLNSIFHFERNHFDRVVHFSFGLLIAYPAREFLIKVVCINKRWTYIIAPIVILSFGAFYELLEMLVAQIVAPEIGTMFLGTQGDEWDTQHDMEVALYGAVIAMFITATLNYFNRE